MKDSYEDEELDLYVGLESKNRTNLKTTTITVTATTTTKKKTMYQILAYYRKKLPIIRVVKKKLGELLQKQCISIISSLLIESKKLYVGITWRQKISLDNH